MEKTLVLVEKKSHSPQLVRAQTRRLAAHIYRKSSAKAIERKSFALINKAIRKLHDLSHILYLPLDLPSSYIVQYADSAFANNANNSS